MKAGVWFLDRQKQMTIGNRTIPVDALDKLLRDAKKNAGIDHNASPVDIAGPFDGKINSIFRITYPRGDGTKTAIFRARVSTAFRYENIVKEKMLFPILDKSLDLGDVGHLEKGVKEILDRKTGSHVFKEDALPVILVQDLYHYDESRELFPYMFSVLEYINGISMYDYIERVGGLKKDGKTIPSNISSQIESMFFTAGEALGKLHKIVFPGFYRSILDIGRIGKAVPWRTLFREKADALLSEAAKHAAMRDLIPEIKHYITSNMDLIPEDEMPVLFHNDYQPQNIIVDPEAGTVKGYIDFDNWQIGAREQDFIKIQHWGTKELNPKFFRAFERGYKMHQHVDDNFQARVDLYTMAWFVLVFNFEMDKIGKNEQNLAVDRRFPAADKYINEISELLRRSR